MKTSTSTIGANRFVLLRKAIRKRLGWYPFRSFDTREQAEAEARHWYYRLACTKYETEFAVVDAAEITPAHNEQNAHNSVVTPLS